MKLTNTQGLEALVKSSEPGLSNLVPGIRTLEEREALIIGESVPFPSTTRMLDLNLENLAELRNLEKLTVPADRISA